MGWEYIVGWYLQHDDREYIVGWYTQHDDREYIVGWYSQHNELEYIACTMVRERGSRDIRFFLVF